MFFCVLIFRLPQLIEIVGKINVASTACVHEFSKFFWRLCRTFGKIFTNTKVRYYLKIVYIKCTLITYIHYVYSMSEHLHFVTIYIFMSHWCFSINTFKPAIFRALFVFFSGFSCFGMAFLSCPTRDNFFFTIFFVFPLWMTERVGEIVLVLVI